MSSSAGEPGSAGKGASQVPLSVALARSRLRRYPSQLLGSILGGVSATGGASAGPAAAAEGLAPSQGVPLLDHSLAHGPLSAAWLGHASTLLRIADRWVLTDPVFSERIGVSVGPVTLGVSRQAPTIDPAHLPHIDLILLSHAHFDHLDKPTLRRLASPSTRVVTAANTRRLVPDGFGDVRELHWGQELRIGPLLISALRPEHWGARTAWDTHRGYNAYVLEAEAARQHKARVLFAGDTAQSGVFGSLGAAGGVDLSIFGIGAYDPWIAKHATPEQVWAMHTAAGGRHLLPMHHSTFELSDEPMDEPMRRLIQAAGEAAPSIVARRLGEMWSLGT
jgi:L-ascorbate metabolism protein UlaG (beta-lactamase superfamily)